MAVDRGAAFHPDFSLEKNSFIGDPRRPIRKRPPGHRKISSIRAPARPIQSEPAKRVAACRTALLAGDASYASLWAISGLAKISPAQPTVFLPLEAACSPPATS
jgi:hypothetical protein